MRLNLQLFALNVTTSIVDYLKSKGLDSSYASRKKYAEQYGISNYSGSGEQNTQLLRAMQENKAPTKSSTVSSNETYTQTAPTLKSNVAGVSDETYANINKDFQISESGQKAQDVATGAKETYITAANTPFSSEEYDYAMQILQQDRDKVISGRTKYTDQVEALMDKITNRDKFSYDMDSDQMFQQYLSSMMTKGASAMADTMGQASMLTGGYGSSYATSAANQAYNAYIEDAYANLPDYYNMAFSAYQMEGEEMYNQFQMYSDADAREYEKLLNNYNMSYQNMVDTYNREYGEYQDRLKNLYDTYTIAQGDADRIYNQEFGIYQLDKDAELQLAQMANSDYWKQQDYDMWLATNDINGDDVVDDNDITASYELQAKYSGGNEDNSGTPYSLSDSEIKRIQEIYDQFGGGEAGENSVLDYLAQKGKTPTSAEDMAIVESVYSSSSSKGSNISATASDFRTTKRDNFNITIGDNSYKVENEGKVTSQKTLDSINKGTTYGDVILAENGKLYLKYGKDYYRIGKLEGFMGWGTSKKSGYDDLLLALQR